MAPAPSATLSAPCTASFATCEIGPQTTAVIEAILAPRIARRGDTVSHPSHLTDDDRHILLDVIDALTTKGKLRPLTGGGAS